MQISNGDTKITIGPEGATVTAWLYGLTNVLFPQQEVVVGTGMKIRGGLPIPFPNFGLPPIGDDARFELKQHGFLRGTVLEVLENQPDMVVLGIPDTVGYRNDFHWPFSLIVQIRALPNGMEHTLTVKHTGDGTFGSMPMGFALHPYFCQGNNPGTVICGRGPYTHHEYETPGMGIPVGTKHCAHVVLPGLGLVTMVMQDAYAGHTAGVYLWTDQPDKYLCVEPYIAPAASFAQALGVFVNPGDVLTGTCIMTFRPD